MPRPPPILFGSNEAAQRRTSCHEISATGGAAAMARAADERRLYQALLRLVTFEALVKW